MFLQNSQKTAEVEAYISKKFLLNIKTVQPVDYELNLLNELFKIPSIHKSNWHQIKWAGNC